MNTTVLIVAGILLTGLLVFLVMKNNKDRKDFEKKENRDYRKPRENEGDIEVEDRKK